ncbi:MAG TPA: DUF3261 domain-containing protein [Myxococcales bacterium]|nr:DUF3261 domain-containing protein [Myxococcales bacterium]
MKKLLLLLLVACAAPRPKEYPGTLLPPAHTAGDFVRTQKLVAHFQGQTRSMDAVLQKEGDLLTLIGMTPFGSKAFVLQQQGVEVSFKSYVAFEMPFPPKYILLDVQRVYFAGLDGAPLPDGEHTAQRDGEQIVEAWQGGRLLRRTFTRLSGDPAGAITVTYQGGMAGGISPAKIEIDNGWVGYQLSINTVQEQRL